MEAKDREGRRRVAAGDCPGTPAEGIRQVRIEPFHLMLETSTRGGPHGPGSSSLDQRLHVTCSIYKLVEEDDGGDGGEKGPRERRLTTLHLWEDGSFKCSKKEVQEKLDGMKEAEAGTGSKDS
ncbi:MAG: hypothetical protein Q9187_002571 [Circinaria calcarea]